MNKRVLIYKPINYLKPTGGPAGYLYNLKEQLENRKDIDFLPNEKISKESFLARMLPVWIVDKIRVHRLKKLLKTDCAPRINIYEYDIIHFHQTTDLFLLRKYLKNYKGKILLTSHSPCAFHIELFERISKKGREKYKGLLRELEIIDKFSFERADYIIFPCKESEEPYFHTWSNYAKIRDKNKILYLPTGIKRCVPRVSKNLIRNKFNIPSDAYVICFVGRHNSIKGYEELKLIGESILKQKKNVYFLIAGSEGPVSKLINARWIEVGWTNDPYSIINASDIFILPNKETYFDLIALEVLSIGKPLLASKTGGNKFFQKFTESAIWLYSSKEEAIDILLEYEKEFRTENELNYEKNVKIYEENFSCEVFSKKYLELLGEVENE